MVQARDFDNAISERLDVRGLVMAEYDRGIGALADIRDQLARKDVGNLGKNLSSVRAAVEAWDGSVDLWIGGHIGRLDADLARSIALVQTAIRFTDLLAQQSDNLRVRLDAARALDPVTEDRSGAMREIHSETLAYAAAVAIYAETRGEGMSEAWLAAIPESFKSASVKYRSYVEATDKFLSIFGDAIGDRLETRPLSPYYPPIAEGVSDPVVLAFAAKAIAEAVVKGRLKELALERQRQIAAQEEQKALLAERTATAHGVPWMTAESHSSQTSFEVACEIAGEIAGSFRQSGIYVQPGWNTSFAIQTAECSNGDRKFVATARMEGLVEYISTSPSIRTSTYQTNAKSLTEAKLEAEAITSRLLSEGAFDIGWKASASKDRDTGEVSFALKFTHTEQAPFIGRDEAEKAAATLLERFAQPGAGQGAKHIRVEVEAVPVLEGDHLYRLAVSYPPIADHLRDVSGSVRIFDTHDQAVEALTKRLYVASGDIYGLEDAIRGFLCGHDGLHIKGTTSEVGFVYDPGDEYNPEPDRLCQRLNTQTPSMQRDDLSARRFEGAVIGSFYETGWDERDEIIESMLDDSAKTASAAHVEVVEERIARGVQPLALLVEHDGRQVPAKGWLDVSDNGRRNVLVAAVADNDGVWSFLRSENGGALMDTGLRSALVDDISLKAVAQGRDLPTTSPYRPVTEADIQVALFERETWLAAMAGRELPAARIAELAASRAGRFEFPVGALASTLRTAEQVVTVVREEANGRGGRFMAALLADSGKAIAKTTADTVIKAETGSTIQTIASVHRALIRAVAGDSRGDITNAVAAVIRVEAAREERDGPGYIRVIDDRTNSQGLDNLREAVEVAGLAEVRNDDGSKTAVETVPYEIPESRSPLTEAEVIVHWRNIEREADRLRERHGLAASEATIAAITDGDRIRGAQPDAGVLASLDPQISLRSISQAVARVNANLADVGLQPRHQVMPVAADMPARGLALLAALQARHLASGRLGQPGPVATVGGDTIPLLPETRRALVGELNCVAERNLRRDNPPVIRGQKPEWSRLESDMLKAASAPVLGGNASALHEHLATRRLEKVRDLHSIVTNGGRAPLDGVMEAIAMSARAAHASLDQTRRERVSAQETRQTISR